MYPDVVILLIFNALLYSVFYGVTASISSLFADVYPFLNQTDVGLCFLAIGGGMMFGSMITGKLLDRDYATMQRKIAKTLEVDTERKVHTDSVTKDENFPLEKVRLRTLPIYFVLYTAAVVGYGWSLETKTSLAVPLILQIFSKALPSATCLLIHLPYISRLQRCVNHEHNSDTPPRSGSVAGVINHCLCMSVRDLWFVHADIGASRTTCFVAHLVQC
jgi:hypothetical protein